MFKTPQKISPLISKPDGLAAETPVVFWRDNLFKGVKLIRNREKWTRTLNTTDREIKTTIKYSLELRVVYYKNNIYMVELEREG